MIKRSKRKGFTAIEMLVVIAVVSLLVSITVPVVGNQTIKSKAAANAANLRTIESAVSLKMVENPDAFESFFATGHELEERSEGILGKVYDAIFGEGESAERRIKYNSLTATIYNELEIGALKITGLTAARGLEAPGRNGSPDLIVNEGAPMVAYITEEGAVLFYGNYTKEDFADVAADGYYDGTTTSGGTDSGDGGFWDDAQQAIDEATCRKEAGSGLIIKGEGKHQQGGDCKCPYCGGEAHYLADKTIEWSLLGGNQITYNTSTKYHECICGKVFNIDCVFGADHKCKYVDCTETINCIDEEGGGWFGNDPDHKCDLCGGDNDHQWCKDTEDSGQSPDHKCNTCGYEMSKCDAKGGYDDSTHTCSYCGKKNSHAYVDGVCACGKVKPVVCEFDGCTRTDLIDEYCPMHQEVDRCGKTVQKKNWMGWVTGLEECTFLSRDPSAECGATHHRECGCSASHNWWNDCGTCGHSHYNSTCDEHVQY